MKRKMAKHVVRPEHWPSLSKETMQFIDSDEFAKKLFAQMWDTADRAFDWYDEAEKNREIARWIPQGGGGDCFLIYPGDENAHECSALYDALELYAKVQGHNDVVDELGNLRHAFLWYDRTEVA